MEQVIEIPKIKKVLYELVFIRGYHQHQVTKVYFKDGSAVTLAGTFPKKEASHHAYFQKGRDVGMTVEEAEVFADSKAPV